MRELVLIMRQKEQGKRRKKIANKKIIRMIDENTREGKLLNYVG